MRRGGLMLPPVGLTLHDTLPPGWGWKDFTKGKDGNDYRNHYCLWMEVITTAAVTAGDILSWATGGGDEGKVCKRTVNARHAAGVAVDTAGVGGLLRMARDGFVDCAYNGALMASIGDPMQAGDGFGSFHKAKYATGRWQVGSSASKTHTNYSAGWVRLRLNINLGL